MDRKLKPCPFCGESEGKEMELNDEDGFKSWVIRCDYCGALGPDATRREKARELWNERVKKGVEDEPPDDDPPDKEGTL